MELSTRILRYAIVLACIIMISCDAPRDNPLDPQSPLYIQGEAPERITDLRMDNLTPSSCRLYWTAPEGAIRYLLFKGDLSWDGSDTTQATRYTGILPAPERGVQSCEVSLQPNTSHIWALYTLSSEGLLSPPSNLITISAPIRDRLATIDLTYRTHNIAWWAGPNQKFLEVFATINDSDGVREVWIQKDTTKIMYLESLGLLPNHTHWSGELYDYEAPNGTLETLLGHRLSLWHTDSLDFTTLDSNFQISRIINHNPRTLSPTNDSLATPNPGFYLFWEDYPAYYNFTYAIDIYHMSASYVPTHVFSDSLISSEQNSYQINRRLTEEPLFFLWTVSVVDEFGNRARSLEARFRVTDNE